MIPTDAEMAKYGDRIDLDEKFMSVLRCVRPEIHAAMLAADVKHAYYKPSKGPRSLLTLPLPVEAALFDRQFNNPWGCLVIDGTPEAFAASTVHIGRRPYAGDYAVGVQFWIDPSLFPSLANTPIGQLREVLATVKDKEAWEVLLEFGGGLIATADVDELRVWHRSWID